MDTKPLKHTTHSLDTAIGLMLSASRSGDLNEVHALWTMVEQLDVLGSDNKWRFETNPLAVAVNAGHIAVVDYLLSLGVFTPNEDILNSAAVYGNLECLRALIPHHSPAALSVALTEAVCANHVKCVHELLAMDPPNTDEAYEVCLIWASARKNMPLLEYFYNHCNPERALDIGMGWWQDEQLELLRLYHNPEAQRERLEQQVGESAGDKRKAKI